MASEALNKVYLLTCASLVSALCVSGWFLWLAGGLSPETLPETSLTCVSQQLFRSLTRSLNNTLCVVAARLLLFDVTRAKQLRAKKTKPVSLGSANRTGFGVVCLLSDDMRLTFISHHGGQEVSTSMNPDLVEHKAPKISYNLCYLGAGHRWGTPEGHVWVSFGGQSLSFTYN